MTGNKHNHEGQSGEHGEPGPGPYWQRMHRDWHFWLCAVFMAAALAIYVLSGDLAWVPSHEIRSAQKRRVGFSCREATSLHLTLINDPLSYDREHGCFA